MGHGHRVRLGGDRVGGLWVGCQKCMSMLHVQGHTGVTVDHGVTGGGRCMNHCMASVRAAACAGMTINEKDLEHTHTHSLTHSRCVMVCKQMTNVRV